MNDTLQGVQSWLIQQRREHLLSTFKTFARESGLVPDYDPRPHDEMCDELTDCIPILGKTTGRIRRKKLYLAPRGTFKTSLIRALIVYCVLKWPSIRIVIARNKHDESKQTLYAIKADFKRPCIVDVFGDIEKRAGIWSEESVQLGDRQEPTIDTAALGISKTGNHPDLVVVDDIINDKNYRSPVVQQEAKDLVLSYYAVMDPWSSLLVSGTRWAVRDVYGWIQAEILENQKTGNDSSWTMYVRGPHNADGTLFFPARLDEAQLKQLQWDYRSNPRIFAANYLNQPYDDETRLFKPEYIEGRFFEADFYATPYPHLEIKGTLRTGPTKNEDGTARTPRWDEDVLDETTGEVTIVPVETTMTMDPALTTNRRSDSTGLTVVCCDARSRWWIAIAKGYKAVPSVVADQALRWIGAFHPRVNVIESAQVDPGMVARIQDGIRELEVRTEIKPYRALEEKHGQRSKEARIESLEPFFRARQIWIHRDACEVLLDQYEAWPDVEHDDVMDALAMQRRVVLPSRVTTLEEAVDLYAEDDDDDLDLGTGERYVVGRVGRSSQTLRIA